MDKQHLYLEMLLSKEKGFEPLEAYAQEHRIPIMDKGSIQFLSQLALAQQPKRILEIGTAIGYSAIKLASVLPDTHITTLERDEEMIRVATDNIAKWKMESQIELVPGDAGDSLAELQEDKNEFDFIFIDAAKAQYKRFFMASEPMLRDSGMIICDNILFKGYVVDPDRAPSTRLKKLALKINDFNRWLSENKTYFTSIVPIGDGIAVSNKRHV